MEKKNRHLLSSADFESPENQNRDKAIIGYGPVINQKPQTMEKRFVNAFTFDFQKIDLETNNLPSVTQPEMTVSLKELISRYTRGGSVATFTPVYSGDGEFDEYPEIEKMDALEKLEFAARIKEGIQKFQNRPAPKPEPDPKPDPKPDRETDGESTAP